MLWQTFSPKLWVVWVEVSPSVMKRNIQDLLQIYDLQIFMIQSKFKNHWFLRLQIMTLCRDPKMVLVPKMGLSNFVAWLVSTLKAKLWKVLMKYKNVMFLTFELFFSKCIFLVLQNFFLPSTYPSKSIFFSGSSNLYDSCFWWSIFSS